MGFRILHFADLHLGASFAGIGMPPEVASRYRGVLRQTLTKIIDLAISEGVDLVSSGGDLYEGERSTPQLGEFLREECARLGQIPIFLVPGNHDPLVKDSLYNLVSWPTNVRLVKSPRLVPFPLKDGLTIWSFAHLSFSQKEPPLKGFKAPAQGSHLLLMHGSDISSLPPGKEAHSPFRPDEVREAGFEIALLGHYHRAHLYPPQNPLLVYPGSPEPLCFDEGQPHGVVIAEIGEGKAKCDFLPLGKFLFSQERLDLRGEDSHNQLRERLRSWAERKGGKGKAVRLILEGQLSPGLEIDYSSMEESLREGFFFLKLINHTYPAYDFKALSQEQTVRGAFVRRLLREGKGEETINALIYGLQAFEGREIQQR